MMRVAAVTIKERKKTAPEAGIMAMAMSLDFTKLLLRSTRKTTPMAYSSEEKMTLAVQSMEKRPTHPRTSGPLGNRLDFFKNQQARLGK